jgi:hypothetical protein
MRKPRTENELQRSLDNLSYEISMFQRLTQGMLSGIAGEGVINNALLESFAIHVRALLGFFYSENSQDDDVIAEDFFLEPDKWKNNRPLKTETLKNANRKANKEIVHLTYERLNVTTDQKPWEFDKIANDLQVVIGFFLNSIPSNLLNPKLEVLRNEKP